MDFFSAVADPSQPILHNDCQPDNANDGFAEAIANRFGSSALLTTRLTAVSIAPPHRPAPDLALPALPVLPRPPRLSAPTPPLSAPPSLSSFQSVVPSTLSPWTEDPTALILDIRAHAAYSTARLPSAVSLSVPSTLLKRPLFSLHRLADMLPSANARARFSAWRSASRILVYDADSSAIPESSNIHGLLRKFKNDGFQGDLAWLNGGFQAVWREMREIIDAHPPTPDDENEDEDELNDLTKTPSIQPQGNVLRTRHLPMAAFSFSSTTASSSSSTNLKRLARGATFPTLPTPSQSLPQPAFNPFFDAVRQNLELSQGITERIPLRLPRRIRHRINDLPFPWLREVASRAAKLAPRNRPAIDSSPSASEESEDDENITSMDIEEGKEILAMQFFKIEVAEQRRLMGIMEHHTRETMIVSSDTGATPSSSSFPYSITAGVEKGAKNRYRHIWPFEHARVRLHQRREVDDDYVNASYVQPIGTNKRYIATQGPLPATFTDFWTLCWQQNVHVIVMLTREVENSMVKCGSYWTETVYGALRLRLVSTTGASPLPEEPSLFPTRPAPQRHLSSPPAHNTLQPYPSSQDIHPYNTHTNKVIRRVFELSHTSYPDVPPRRVIHLQYLEWPDMNVPDDPHGILELIREVNGAVDETQSSVEDAGASTLECNDATPSLAPSTEIDHKTGVSKHALGKNRPVLLHCSAGVGRTGGFIAVDAILDAIRRELREKMRCEEVRRDKDAMDVDLPAISSPAPIMMSPVAEEKDDVMSNQPQPMETVSITITAGNGQRSSSGGPAFVVHVPVAHMPSPDTTNPEALRSEVAPSVGNTLTMQTRAWAEDVSRADGPADTALETSQRLPQQGPPESESHARTDISSDTSNSSSHSLLDLSNLANASGNYHFPQSSSFGTSLAGVSSPEPSPPRLETVTHSSLKATEPLASSALLSVDHVSTSSGSLPPSASRTAVGDDPDPSRKGSVALQQPPGWLGEPLRNRSPSPMTRTASGESAAPSASPRERSRFKPTFSLRAPPSYTGGISSDAEPPSRSRSASPSADEGSVASQVSSYHTHLKNHHCMPLHAKSLPISLDKPNKGKSGRNPRLLVPVPERPTLTMPSMSAQVGLAATVDFKQPRPLHDTAAPRNLSSFEEPICEVIQDMREQRMSLCQSLRQYVFVHAAVIEGSLMIVDEERELRKQREREKAVEMCGIQIGPERRDHAESPRDDPPQGAASGGIGAGGSSANLDASNKLNVNPNEEDSGGVTNGSASGSGSGPAPGHPPGWSDMSGVSTSIGGPSSGTAGDRKTMQDEGEGYFSSFMSQPPLTLGLGGDEGAGKDESVMESVFSPRPRVTTTGLVLPPSASSLQRPRLSLLDARLSKRSTSPSDFLRDGSGAFDDDQELYKRPSVKRKQPSGETRESKTRKRAQNERSSSRERDKELELERRLSNGGSHSHSREGVLDTLTPGLVR